MTISIYAAAVPVFDQMLTALERILGKAEAHVAARSIAPDALLQARLFPDMLPLTRQVQIAGDYAKGASARLAGVEVPVYEDAEKSFAELRERLSRTLAFIRGLDPASFADAETRTIAITRRGQTATFEGGRYLFHTALPNFYFHVTTAYAIMRHNGLEIGKADYLGT